MKLEVRGGRVHDPANGIDGEERTLYIDGERLVTPQDPASFSADRVIDARGKVVMAGGIDLHSHIAGGAVNRARRLQVTGPARGLLPSTRRTGELYASMGYGLAVEAAMPPSGCRQAHLELSEIAGIDRAALLVLTDSAPLVDALADGEPDLALAIARQMLVESGALGIKAINPGGHILWRQARARVDGIDRKIDGTPLTPRDIIVSLARIAHELGLGHPLHLHANALGVAGNVDTTLETMRALSGHRAHLAHVQFHAYDRARKKSGSGLRSGAERFLQTFADCADLTADVGQVWFGPAMTLTGDRPVEHRLWRLTGNPWVNIDSELEIGCGLLPVEYRRRSDVHATQFAVGLELLLLSPDPWRLVLTTDHPNGASFRVYPQIIAALMDREFRREQLSRIGARALGETQLASGIEREYTLGEIATITRAAPARILGLPHKGHLGEGADADVCVYDDDRDRVRMFSQPRWVMHAGEIIVDDGEWRGATSGRTYRADLEEDGEGARQLAAWRERYTTLSPGQFGLAASERQELAAAPRRGSN